MGDQKPTADSSEGRQGKPSSAPPQVKDPVTAVSSPIASRAIHAVWNHGTILKVLKAQSWRVFLFFGFFFLLLLLFLEVRSKSQQPVIEYYAVRDGSIIKPCYLKMSEQRDGSLR